MNKKFAILKEKLKSILASEKIDWTYFNKIQKETIAVDPAIEKPEYVGEFNGELTFRCRIHGEVYTISSSCSECDTNENNKHFQSIKDNIKRSQDIDKVHERINTNQTRTVEQVEQILNLYKKTINNIDDFFEYKNESKKDRAFIYNQLDSLTQKIRKHYDNN